MLVRYGKMIPPWAFICYIREFELRFENNEKSLELSRDSDRVRFDLSDHILMVSHL